MARPLRVEFAGAIHHVMSRGNARAAIVADDADRWRWLRLLERATLRHGWRVFTLALMDNHYHLFLQTPEPNLSLGLHQLNSGYATYFNARHRRVGHVLQGRFKSIVVEEHGYWLELSRYVHLNPVRAGLVSRPEDWPWCSYAGYHRPARRLKWGDYGRVLAEFGGDTPAGRAAYRDYVAEGLGRPLDSPLSKAVHGAVLGSDRFVARIRRILRGRDEDEQVPDLARLRRAATMGQVIAAVVSRLGGAPDTWQPGRRCDDISRAVAAHVARETAAASSREIAAALGYRHLSSISAACRRVEQALANGRLRDDIEAILKDLAEPGH